jgi:hypothetical protein
VTQTSYPYDSGAGSVVLEAQWRAMARNWLATGVIDTRLNELEVTQSTPPAMTVDVASGQAWIEGVFYENDAVVQLAISANGLGNPRIDTVVVRINFVANTWALAVVIGTPAVSPVAPTLEQDTSLWELPLADVAVANGATSIGTANLTDRRTIVVPGGGGGADILQTQVFGN